MKVGKNPGRFLSLLLTVVSAQGLIASETLVLREGHSFLPWLVRIDSLGDTLWTRFYALRDDTLMEIDHLREGENPRIMMFWYNSITASGDGGYVIHADFETANVIFKVDSAGVLQWWRDLAFYPTLRPWTSDLLPTCDGGYVIVWDHITAFADFDGLYIPVAVEAVFLKLSAEGDSLWARTFSGFIPEEIIQTNDCGYVIAAIRDRGGVATHLIKVDSSGNQQWCRCYPKLGVDHLETSPDGSITMYGYAWKHKDPGMQDTSYEYDSEFKYLRCRVDSAGSILDERLLWYHESHRSSGVCPEDKYLWKPEFLSMSPLSTPDGGYLVPGDIFFFQSEGPDSLQGYYNALTCFKHDSSGRFVWVRRYLKELDCDHSPRVFLMSDGYLIVTQTRSLGAKNIDLLLIRLDDEGNVLWRKLYGNERNEFPGPAYPTGDGGFLILAKRAPQIYVIEDR